MKKNNKKPGRSDVPIPWPASTEPLDRAEEMALLRRWKNAGDTAARDRVIQANIRFTVSVAVQYQGRGLPLCDLVAEGILGMLVAIDRFEPERGFKFISYAVWWIRQKILVAVHGDRTVKMPENFMQIFRAYRTLEHDRLHRGLDADFDELVAELNLNADQISGLRMMVLGNFSWQNLVDQYTQDRTDNEFTPAFLADANAPDAIERVPEDQERTEAVAAILGDLEPRERYILERYYGLDGEPPQNLDEIGRQLNLTRERVRQIRLKIFAKLAKIERLKTLHAEMLES